MQTVEENYTAWRSIDSLIELDKKLFQARMRFYEEERKYKDAVYFYHKRLREFDMQNLKDDDYFGCDIECILKENNAPVDEVKKFDDPKVFEYLISNINKFIKISSDKKEILKELKPNSISKLSVILSALDNDYLLKQIIQNSKKADYINPLVKPVIKDTYGAIVYEDQVDEILNLVLDANGKEADMFYESLTHLSKIKNLDKVDGSTLLMDYLRENHCEIYTGPYKTQYYGFISTAIEKGMKENKAKKLFNLLLVYFINSGRKFKNTEIYRAKHLYLIAYIELNYPNRLLDSLKQDNSRKEK